MTTFNAFHAIAAARGDGLLPEFLGLRPRQAEIVSIEDFRAGAKTASAQEQAVPATPANARKRPQARRPAHT